MQFIMWANIILIAKSQKNIAWEESYRQIFKINLDTKILSNILTNQIVNIYKEEIPAPPTGIWGV